MTVACSVSCVAGCTCRPKQSLAAEVRIAMEGGDTQAEHSPKLETRADVDYERSRYYEFVLLRSKHTGSGFIANVRAGRSSWRCGGACCR